MTLTGRDFYKTAFVVADLEKAAARLSAAWNFDWLEVPAAPLEYRAGDKISTVTLRALITKQRPRLHLLEEVPGTPWTASRSGAAHHAAYWVDDIVEAAERMVSAGFTIECCDAVDTSAPTQWAYFISPDGVRLELLDRQGAADPESAIDQLPEFDRS